MKDKHVTVTAVIVAAGGGTRMGGVSKPLIRLGGKAVFSYVLEAFEKANTVNDVVVVCREKAPLQELAKGCSKPITFVSGGETRSKSVHNGVAAAGGSYVCIHDCARPFIKPEDIDTVVNAAVEKGAACACGSVYDTVKYVDRERKLIYTPDRDRLFALQTPQVFRKEIYEASYIKGLADGLKTTDDTALAENAGFYVEYVSVGSYNTKLTDAEDVKRAKAMLFLMNRGEL